MKEIRCNPPKSPTMVVYFYCFAQDHTPHKTVGKYFQNSATYWEGNSEAESLQRIYGISFPDTKQMKEWKHLQVSVFSFVLFTLQRLIIKGGSY